MPSAQSPASVFADSKNHYEILDGLRGVAAVMVILMHLFEIFCNGNYSKMIINHGYLAVDFFFLLSGFVIGYAYDDRWKKMTVSGFFKRRLIRLHPMIIVGMTIGAICFYFGDSAVLFPNIHATSVGKMILVMLIGYTLIPVPLSLDIRGWAEMHPLDGPAWTLFFEYIGNILYALFLRKVSNVVLSILVILAGAALLHMGLTRPQGDIIGGWSLTAEQLQIGFTRLLYPFLAGLLLSRVIKPGKLNNAFFWCSLLLVVSLSVPRIGTKEAPWQNGLYEALTILLLFPLIVFMGASGEIKNSFVQKLCKFLGNISYPVYIIHYPLVYIFSAWVVNNKIPMEGAWMQGLLVLGSAILIAYAGLKWYDIPVRKWLTGKFVEKK